MKSLPASITLLICFLALEAPQTIAGGCTHIWGTSTYLCGVVHNQSPYTMKYTSKENEDEKTKSTPDLCAFWNWSGGFTEPDHKKTVWCKQNSLSSGGNKGGGKDHDDVDGFTFADRNYLWGKRFDVITKGVWTQIHNGDSVICTGGGGPKKDMPVCKLD